MGGERASRRPEFDTFTLAAAQSRTSAAPATSATENKLIEARWPPPPPYLAVQPSARKLAAPMRLGGRRAVFKCMCARLASAELERQK